ncbi:hypothetical protein ZWY2020_014358 [Hordeum vulgare]|nr:hypothetical protein ZWY2020_014358 [Hordeum vulgare]
MPPFEGASPSEWAGIVDSMQRLALLSRLSLPIIYGVDVVHGHNNVIGATIFPHNVGLGASRHLLSHCKQFNNVISETTLPSLTGKVHGGRLNFRVFHWIAQLLPATLFGIGTVSSSPSSAPCLLSPVALMILVAFEPRLWCGSMAIVPWLSG